MKSLTVKLSLATVLTMVAATAASAQTMTVSIPFAFLAGGAEQPAGTYAISSVLGGDRFYLLGHNTRSVAILHSAMAVDVPAQSRSLGKGYVVFACVEEACELRQIWSAGSYAARAFPASHPKREGAGLAVLRVISANAR